jgi:hypothetical protein
MHTLKVSLKYVLHYMRLYRIAVRFKSLVSNRVLTYSLPENPEFVIDENDYNDWSIYRTSISRFQDLRKITNSLKYSANPRRFQALGGLCGIDTLELPTASRVLMVGYREDTYDVQVLAKLNVKPVIDYLDIAHLDAKSIINIEAFDSFTIVQKNAYDLVDDLSLNSYDLVYFSRDCLDVFEWKQALKILEAAQRAARVAVVAHIQSIFWSAVQESGQRSDANWLVLDPLNDPHFGVRLSTKLKDHIDEYVLKAGSSVIQRAIEKAANEDIIRTVSETQTGDPDRVIKLEIFPGNPILCSVQLDSSPDVPKKSFYMSSILLWRTSA